MSATIKRYVTDCNKLCSGDKPRDECDVLVVLHTTYLASHAYDQEKERALFEAQRQPSHCIKFADGSYQYVDVDLKWLGWQLCAKSRAKTAGCE